ncbi:nucleotidyltransferase [Virgibacillus pantothenticus]|uniref:nucleotidyltransferase n=1 Tax=Virgibacillus pantothenticus TaxID=1473 RepID=UPI001C218489|nr:nucleotidyltransferase [Virgibacillus pantothenticus]MBU8567949.1 nucleotidyltransferase [Virgibacillus pantothenticus]MBU8601794.1 nucleotidyltransferase [Virgibacillus pantothenticus]MBU8635948.1 nucleotidyltransferase [Virgibacillus pantothenticus]MBU8643632.1 nucleotidyltransferase [Virgibacillus pantothenticus]MBU8647772.1 nucleotidyltransferase [Virgibacillus pantothenticus]
MLIQNIIIQTVREKCIEDELVSACMMYGSFTKGEGDQYSDVEFYIFIEDDEIENFSSRHWVSEVYPVDLIFYNEYGTEVVIFSNMIRGEFHFLPVSKIEVIKSFKPTGVFPDTESMYIYDSTEQLKPLLDDLGGAGPDRMTDENVNFAFNNFVNAWMMGVNVMKRGELARSLEALTHVQKFILQLIRVKENTVERWLNSTKNLEEDISTESYKDYVSVTSKLKENEMKTAYKNALNIVEVLNEMLSSLYMVDVDKDLISKLYSYLYE